MQESSDNRKNDVRNTAKDGAHVDAQIGVVHGDVTFYRVDDAATPEQRFDTGCNYLEGNMSRRAEEIIAKAFVDGYRTTRCCYYWMLSVLSDRPLDLLTELEQSNLTTATKEAEKHPPDEWTDAIDVVNALMTSIVDLDAVNEPTFADVDESMSRFDGLTSPRRNEIRRHLERILSGVVQDRLEVQDAERVATVRMGNGRTRRADLFFHPPPAAPLPLILPRTRRPLLLWTGFAVAVVIAGAIARWLDTAMAREAGLVVGTTVLLAGMAAYVALNLPTDINRRRQLWHDGRLTGQTWEHWTGEPDREFAKPNSYRFGRRMRDVLLRSFYHAAADRAVDVKEWIDDTEGIRRTLCSEMAEQFSYRSKLPATRSVEWLANHHAHRYLSMWRAGGFATRDEQEKARPWLRPGVHLVAPLVTAGGSVLTVLLPRGVAPPAASLLTIALVVALLTAATCARSAVVLQSTRAYIDSEFAQRHRTETAAYEAWSSRLADRPSDSEISEWLDHDKLHVKATAMRQYGLSNRDLLDHFFVVGSGTGARSARVAHGPPRYTDYEIWLFLLTSAGVRQMKVQLELRTGDLTDEERMSFRYDAITAAYVVEKALRPGSASATDDDDDRSAVFRAIRAIRGKLVLHQLFRLTLNNNDEFSLPLANFDDSLWEKVHDDPERIAQLTRDASGAEAALRILEGIAGEGSAWVEQEKARRRRTVRYHGRDRERLALTSASPEEQP